MAPRSSSRRPCKRVSGNLIIAMKAIATCMVDQHHLRKIKEKNNLCSTRPIRLIGPSEKNKHHGEKKQARNCNRKRKGKTICVQQGLLGS